MDVLENFRADRPKIFGCDYFHVIYGACFLLCISMAVVYQIVDDHKIRRMVLTQGILSIGLVGALMYYNNA